MVSLLDLVLGNGKPDDAGELRLSGHGAVVPEQGAGRSARRGPPGADRDRPSEDQGPRLKHISSPEKIVKEPLEILLFNPPSFRHFQVYVFHFRRRILVG